MSTFLPFFFLNRPRCMQLAGELPPAVAAYDRALQLEPQHVNAIYNRALALQDDGDLGRALAGYAAALAIDPRYEPDLARPRYETKNFKRDTFLSFLLHHHHHQPRGRTAQQLQRASGPGRVGRRGAMLHSPRAGTQPPGYMSYLAVSYPGVASTVASTCSYDMACPAVLNLSVQT